MTSLFSNTMSPAKDGSSSLPRRSSNLGKPPLRALYDLLIAPMEGVSAAFLGRCLPADGSVPQRGDRGGRRAAQRRSSKLQCCLCSLQRFSYSKPFV